METDILLLWLSRIAHNCARNWQRGTNRYRRKTSALAIASEETPENHGNVEQLIRQGLAYRCLRDIEPKKLDIFIQAEVFGMSCREIAETGEINPNTVRSRLNAARQEVTAIANRLLASDQKSNATHIVGFLREAFQVPQDRVEKRLQGCLLALGPWMMASANQGDSEVIESREQDLYEIKDGDSRIDLGAHGLPPVPELEERSTWFKRRTTTAIAALSLLLTGISGSFDLPLPTELISNDADAWMEDSTLATNHDLDASAMSLPTAVRPIIVVDRDVTTERPNLDSKPEQPPQRRKLKKTPTEPDSDLSEENELLNNAIKFENRQDWSIAEYWLVQHRKRFQWGQLAHVRMASLIRVYCKWGKDELALSTRNRALKMKIVPSQVDPAFRHCQSDN